MQTGWLAFKFGDEDEGHFGVCRKLWRPKSIRQQAERVYVIWPYWMRGLWWHPYLLLNRRECEKTMWTELKEGSPSAQGPQTSMHSDGIILSSGVLWDWQVPLQSPRALSHHNLAASS